MLKRNKSDSMCVTNLNEIAYAQNKCRILHIQVVAKCVSVNENAF